MHAISLSNRETCCLILHMTTKLFEFEIYQYLSMCVTTTVGSVYTCWLSIRRVSFDISAAAGFLRCFQCEGMNLGRIRTCCCAAWPPSAGSVVGLSWVLFWSSPPATQESHSCSWPRCWHPPTPGLLCRGECLKRWFPPRRHLCSCSRPHSRQTPSSFLIHLNVIFHRVFFPEFLQASLVSVGQTEWDLQAKKKIHCFHPELRGILKQTACCPASA